MFYNRNAVLLEQVFSGEFVKALRERREGYSPRGWGDGATPLAEETVREWLDEYGFAVKSKSGIRIFHDHLPKTHEAGIGSTVFWRWRENCASTSRSPPSASIYT